MNIAKIVSTGAKATLNYVKIIQKHLQLLEV